MKRIAIVGAGGGGGYFGGRLAAAGADVSFLAPGTHLAALRAGGLESSVASEMHTRAFALRSCPSRPARYGPQR